MSNKFANRVLVSTATTGTGTVTLGAALAGYQTFAAGGIANADTVRYLILDGLAWEIGIGMYTASGTTLSRDTVEQSSLPANAKLTLSGGASVAVIASQADYSAMTKGPATSVTNNRPALFDGTTGRLLKQHTATLGTAAAADITTSATDTTAGRLWANGPGGMFGLGAFTLTGASTFGVTSDATGLADIPATSFFVHSGAGKPGDAPLEGAIQGAGVKVGGGANWNATIWAGLGSGRWFGRVAPSSGDVGPWCEFVHNRNLLGTVSQSSGIPTGAAFQGNASAASPAGGYSQRTADGFQTVHHVVTSSSSADTTVTFTDAFLAGSSPAVSIASVGDAPHERRIVSISPTAVVFSIRDSGGARIAVPAHLTITGRWSAMT
jgi:hypothetical protein